MRDFKTLARKIARRVVVVYDVTGGYDVTCQRRSAHGAYCRLDFYGYESGSYDCYWIISERATRSTLRSRYLRDTC